MLYKSCKKLEDELLRGLLDEEDLEYEFSEAFKYKMKNLIKYEDIYYMRSSIYSNSKRVGMVLLLIITGLLTVTISVDAIRIKVINVITEIYEEFTTINFIKEKDDISIEEKFNPMTPSYIPLGFKEIDKVESSIGVFIVYENDEYLQIRYSCDDINNNSIILDTEEALVENIKVNGYDAKYIIKNNIQQILWNDKTSYYLIDMESRSSDRIPYDQDELLKMAKSIKK